MNFLIIQLAADEAVFATFGKKGGALVFSEASRHPVDLDHPVAALLPQVAAARSPETKIVLSLPPALLFTREVELPISDRRKVREILPLELKGETAIDTDELVFESLPLENGKFLAIWAKRQEVAEQIRMMAEHGLEPEYVTASLFHWRNLLSDESRDDTVAVTDGESLAVYRQGNPVYFRPLENADADAEIARTLAALEISREVTVKDIQLHGRAARSSAPEGLLLPVAGELAATFPRDPSEARDLAGVYALARACANGDVIDFRRGDLAYTAGREKARRKLRLTIALGTALIVLLFAETGLRYYQVHRDLTSLNKSINTIYREIFPTRKKSVDEVAEARAEIKRLTSIGQDSPILPVLSKLAELKGEDVLGIYEAEIEGGTVRIKGDARSVQAVNDFNARAAAAFSNGELGEIKSRSDGTVTFVFRATLKGGEK